MSELTKAIEEIELPEEFTKLYEYRIKSLFEWLNLEYNLNISEATINENMMLGKLIIKNEVIAYDLETSLSLCGYELFGEIKGDKFEQMTDKDYYFSNNIEEGKILIGFVNNFSKIILVTKSYTVADRVNILIN